MDDMDKKFVEMYKYFGRIQGMDELMVEIFATLYISPKEVAMDVLAKKTGYSLASISNKIKLLENIGWIRRIKKPGSKKVFLIVEKSIGVLLKEGMLHKERAIMATIKKEMPLIIEEGKKTAKNEVQKRKVKILERYYKEVIVMESFLIDMAKQMKDLDMKDGKE